MGDLHERTFDTRPHFAPPHSTIRGVLSVTILCMTPSDSCTLQPIHFDTFLKLASNQTSNSGKFKIQMRSFLDRQVYLCTWLCSYLLFTHRYCVRLSIFMEQISLDEDDERVQVKKWVYINQRRYLIALELKCNNKYNLILVKHQSSTNLQSNIGQSCRLDYPAHKMKTSGNQNLYWCWLKLFDLLYCMLNGRQHMYIGTRESRC